MPITGFGTTSGFVLHTGLRVAKRYGLINSKLNRNTAMLTVLGCGALGMFLGATKTGKENVHNLHPIFQVGAVPPKADDKIVGGDTDGRPNYRQTVQQAQQLQQSSNSSVDVNQLKEAQGLRRRSLAERITKGQGFTDSHGGKWFHDNDGDGSDSNGDKVNIDQLREAQVLRRQSLTDRIKKGSGLSDSHGGKWFGRNNE